MKQFTDMKENKQTNKKHVQNVLLTKNVETSFEHLHFVFFLPIRQENSPFLEDVLALNQKA